MELAAGSILTFYGCQIYINGKYICDRASRWISPLNLDQSVSRSQQTHENPTPLTFQILLALADEARHGYGIIKEIEERGGEGSGPSTGALYLALQRMQGHGLIEETPAPADPAADARRRYYRLTPTGKEVAEQESQRLAALVAAARNKKLLAEGT